MNTRPLPASAWQVATDRDVEILPERSWRTLEAAHHRRVDRLVAGHRTRASRGRKHPVEDFLFTYYSLRPARLRRWHGGAGAILIGADRDAERAAWRDHVVVESDAGLGLTLDRTSFLARRGEAVRHVRDLLAATAGRPPHLGCFGLHEWAMVYRLAPDDVRHAGWPLRLGSAGTDKVVESHRIRCTHHDAVRFFTAAARPLNQVQPRREDQIALEQPGCLHATMDLYKWAYKLMPAVRSDVVADAFELARDARVLDMRASPYDLSELGHPPIPIETPEGRAEYVEQQRAFADRGTALRVRLLAVSEALLSRT